MKNVKSKKTMEKVVKGTSFEKGRGFGNGGSSAASTSDVSLWNSGFSAFKRRIGEQLQMCGFSDNCVDDDDLMPFYRMGESETYVLSALGCSVGM